MDEPLTDHLLPAAPLASLDKYTARGGGLGLASAREMDREQVIAVVQASGLRGRGGAGFPTGLKWRSVASGGAEAGERFVVANGAEGEPGSFKDRPLLRRNPYQVLEGVVIACETVGAHRAYIGIKASFVEEAAALDRALHEMADAGWLGDLTISVVGGPESYLFGEEKGLLEVIEGEDPLPRQVPPYLYGLFSSRPNLGWSAPPPTGPSEAELADPAFAGSNPTVVNNVETLANVPLVLGRGVAWYRSLGTEESPGPVICTVTGDVRRPGFAEVPMGLALGEVIDLVGGGVLPGRSVKAVLSGVANPVLTGADLATPVTHEAMRAAGSGLGAAGFVVYDDTRDMVQLAHSVSRFLYVESCGQCPACKFGSGEVTALLERIRDGLGQPGDVDTIAARLRTVTDQNRCYLGEQEQQVIASLLTAFPADVSAALEGRGSSPVPPVCPISDLADGVAVPDERQLRKRPDWTYAPDVPVSVTRPVLDGNPPGTG